MASLYLYVIERSASLSVPVTGVGGPLGCETPKLSHFLENRLTDGGGLPALRAGRHLPPQEDSWYSFLFEAESTPVRLEALGK
jgi:hypothetical protein